MRTDKRVPQEVKKTAEKAAPGRNEFREMKGGGDSAADKMQVDVANAVGRRLELLKNKGYFAGTDIKKEEGKEEESATAGAYEAIETLKDFHYNIGFAGGMSAGKSTVVNALIQYPLMPTCVQATTCTPVELIYSDEIRIVVTDDDTKKIIMDKICANVTKNEFDRLAQYACIESNDSVIENLQLFTDRDLSNINDLKPTDLDMNVGNPRHAAVLMMILLTVDANQNIDADALTENQKKIIQFRNEQLQFFGIKKENVNISVVIQWDAPILKSGIRLIDLPGLGSGRNDLQSDGGRVRKGHDETAKEAIRKTDSMVLVTNEGINGQGEAALNEMISSLCAREVLDPGACIIPLINVHSSKEDEDQVRKTAAETYATQITNIGKGIGEGKVKKSADEIRQCVAIYGEWNYMDLPKKERTLFIQKKVRQARKEGDSESEISEEMEKWERRLEKAYGRSGIKELMEFFRHDFVEKGKYEKAFSTITAMKRLQTHLLAIPEGVIKTSGKLADVTEKIATEAIAKLKEAAGTPINNEQQSIEDNVEKHKNDMSKKIEELSDETARLFEENFEKAVNKYIANLSYFTNKLALAMPLHPNEAEILKNASNRSTYNRLCEASESFSVDLTDVNAAYASLIGECDKDIEAIYDDAEKILVEFERGYEGELEEKIEEYREQGADGAVIEILEKLAPIVKEMVEEVLSSAKDNLANGRNSVRKAEKELASEIALINNEWIEIEKNHVIGPITNLVKGYIGKVKDKISKWLFGKDHVSNQDVLFVKVKGNDGILERLNETHLTDDEKQRIKTRVKEACNKEILLPINQWYSDVSNSINANLIDLLIKITALLDKTAKQLKMNAEDREKEIDEAKKKVKEINSVFADMKKDLRVCVQQALQLPENEEYKNSTAEKWLKEA